MELSCLEGSILKGSCHGALDMVKEESHDADGTENNKMVHARESEVNRQGDRQNPLKKILLPFKVLVASRFFSYYLVLKFENLIASAKIAIRRDFKH